MKLVAYNTKNFMRTFLCYRPLAFVAWLCLGALSFALEVGGGKKAVVSDASTSRVLTIHQCIEMVLENNIELDIERIAPRLQEAAWQTARGAFEPNLTFGADKEDATRPGNNQVSSYSSGVETMLPIGTTVGVEGTTYNSEDIADRAWDSKMSFTVSQPILKGFGTDVNLADIRVARKGKQGADAAFEFALSRLVMDVFQVYYDLIYARSDLAAKQESVGLANQLFKDNQARMDAGVMSPLDISQARTEAASRQESAIRAEQFLKETENRMKRLIYRDMSTKLEERIVPAEVPLPPTFANPMFNVMSALKNRADLKEKAAQMEQADIRLAYAGNQLLPTVNVDLGYDFLGRDGQFPESVGRVREPEDQAWSAGISVKIPIGSSGERGRKKSRELEKRKSVLAYKGLEQSVIVQVSNAASAVHTNQKRHESARQATELSREILEAEQEKLKTGSSTTYLVSQFQRDLANAKTNELKALADWHKSIAELSHVEGTLLSRSKISLERSSGR